MPAGGDGRRVYEVSRWRAVCGGTGSAGEIAAPQRASPSGPAAESRQGRCHRGSSPKPDATPRSGVPAPKPRNRSAPPPAPSRWTPVELSGVRNPKRVVADLWTSAANVAMMGSNVYTRRCPDASVRPVGEFGCQERTSVAHRLSAPSPSRATFITDRVHQGHLTSATRELRIDQPRRGM